MKKTTLLVASLCAFNFGFSQDDVTTLTNKKGQVILPQSGDWALGFDAVPMMNFALNAINIQNNTGQTATNLVNYQTGLNQVIVGKQFIEDKKAYRVKVGINTSSASTTTFGDDPLTPNVQDPENVKISTQKIGNNNFTLGGGMEMRRGHNRLQGFYGAEALLSLNSNKTVNKYEIEWNQTAQDSGYVSIGDTRTLTNKSGLSIGLGVRGFIGVEYFVASKISIAAEYGWGLGFGITPRGKMTTETWEDPDNDNKGTLKEKETEGTTKMSFIGAGVDNGTIGGGTFAINAIFHF